MLSEGDGEAAGNVGLVSMRDHKVTAGVVAGTSGVHILTPFGCRDQLQVPVLWYTLVADI